MKRWTMLALSILSVATTAKAGPMIVGNSRNPRCQQALEMADAAFASTSASLIWPIAMPSQAGQKIVLKQGFMDISGGNALNADPASFSSAELTISNYRQRLYWRTTPRLTGMKLAVVDSPFNWRGDTYEVYLFDDDANLASLRKELLRTEGTPAERAFKPILGENRWLPPVILQDSAAGVDWLIDRGEPWEVMADWKVAEVMPGGMAWPCRISFAYGPAQKLDRLPAVRDFADAANEALGPGTGEGTLRPTDRIRDTVRYNWANAALRPWSMTDKPYNSRDDVEQGLDAWQKNTTKRIVLRQRINAKYREAQRALTDYYRSHFNYSNKAAQATSHLVMDHMLRTYFVFSESNP